VIAAGTRPTKPVIEGLQDVPCLTWDEVLRLPKQPRRLIVVGGGFIAAEDEFAAIEAGDSGG
jgi:pyruvate/2-oxoglutarate dehydrogenase complex dihydrolipoamide dehydrogenase (E3) component